MPEFESVEVGSIDPVLPTVRVPALAMAAVAREPLTVRPALSGNRVRGVREGAGRTDHDIAVLDIGQSSKRIGIVECHGSGVSSRTRSSR